MQRQTPNHERGPELPALDPGVRLLELDSETRATGPLHSLVLDHLLLKDGTAVWLDAGRNAVTQSLAEIAPSMRLLDRITVARGFTPHQHYELAQRLPEQVDDDTTLLVCPDIDLLYRDAETYADEGEELMLRALAAIAGVANRRDIPALVTRSRADAFADPIKAAARETIACRQTRFGPRFSGADFETLVYPSADGTVQTTLAFWKRILQARQRAVTASQTRGVTAYGAN